MEHVAVHAAEELSILNNEQSGSTVNTPPTRSWIALSQKLFSPVQEFWDFDNKKCPTTVYYKQ